MVRTDAYNAISSIYSRSMDQGPGKAKGLNKTGKTPSSTKTGDIKSASKSSSTSKTETPKLSKAATELLDRLKKEHEDLDIMVSNYSSLDEAKDIMKGSTKEVSVLFTAEELEEMAADPEKEKEMMANVDKAKAMSEDINNAFGETLNENSQGDISRIGIEFKSDGTTEMFAELEKTSAQMQEKIDAAREKRAAEKKESEKAAAEKAEEKKAEAKEAEEKEAAEAKEEGQEMSITENARPGAFNGPRPMRQPEGPIGQNPYAKPDTVKTVSVSANTQEGLLMALQNVNWSAAQEAPAAGGNLSFQA